MRYKPATLPVTSPIHPSSMVHTSSSFGVKGGEGGVGQDTLRVRREEKEKKILVKCVRILIWSFDEEEAVELELEIEVPWSSHLI
jgi:hypothetical protein